MRTNNKNNESKTASRYTRKAIADLKAALNAEYLQEIELVKYGIQIFNVTPENEFDVIVTAERDIKTGRYFFITREGVRVAWSTLDTDKLIHACVDFLDQMVADETTTTESDHKTVKEHVTAVRVADIAETIADACATCYDSPLISSDMALDIDKFNRAVSQYGTAPLPWYFAVRHQGSESGSLDHVAERCRVLGAPVYVIEVKSDTDAGRYRLTIYTDAEARELVAPADTKADTIEAVSEPESEPQADTCESNAAETIARAAFYQLSESKRKTIRYAAHLIAAGGTVEDRGAYLEVNKTEWLAAVTIDAADADHLRHLLTRKAKAAEVTARDCEARELTDAAKVAATRASRCKTIAERLAKVARVVLLAVTLTTGTPADAETVESPDNFAELLTTDPARELAALRAAGLTVTRYEIKDAPATLREVATC